MKKSLLIFSIILSIFIPCNVFASTNTFERTNDNLRVGDWINLDSTKTYNILKTPSVDEKEKIYDFADLFTEEEETNLYNEAIKYIDNYNMDMIVVTTDTNNKLSARDYADDFYDYNMFGTDYKHSGILLLIDMQNRRIEIVTTGEAIVMYDDNRIESLLDGVYDGVADQKYAIGANNFISKSSSLASRGIPSSNKYLSVDEFGNLTENRPFPISVIIFVDVFITAIVILILVSKNKMVNKATTAGIYLDRNSKSIRTISDTLVNTSVSKVPISSDSGGSHGGSSTHHGSSGISHGGGGRSF